LRDIRDLPHCLLFIFAVASCSPLFELKLRDSGAQWCDNSALLAHISRRGGAGFFSISFIFRGFSLWHVQSLETSVVKIKTI
jgi:hypothetical protein